MRVTIQSLSSTGKGVATLQKDGFSRAVFVQGGVPGDVLDLTITSQKKIYYEAKMESIVSPSPHRVKPICPHFGACGACSLLHVSYDEQLVQKEALLKHYLHKAGLTIPPIIVVPSSPLHYRDKIRVQFTKEGKPGFFARKSNSIVPISSCSIIREDLNKVFSTQGSDEKRFAFDYKTKKMIDENSLGTYYVADIPLLFSPKGFVQNNLSLNEKLVNTVMEHIYGSTVLDLFAGNGNFSVPLAKRGYEVVAVEGDKLGFSLLEKNKDKNNCANLSLVRADANEFITEGFDTIILDPPRDGALHLERFGAQRVIYVSCNARALATDLKKLSHYTLDAVYLFDMFAQTMHFETVAVLSLRQ